jgi:hypothetical protein
MGSGIAKRSLPKAHQGCFNPELVSLYYQPGTGCDCGRNRLAVESKISVTQGSRSGNPGLWDETALR